MASLNINSIFEKMFHHALDMLCAFDQKGRFVQVSDSCQHLLGYTSSELAGQPYLNYVLPADRERTIQEAQHIMSGQNTTTFQNRYERKEGNITPIVWSATWSEEDELMFCIAREVPDGTGCTQQAYAIAQQHKAMFDNHPDGICIENKDGVVTEANKAFSQMIGCHKKELVGLPTSAFLQPNMASVNHMSLQQALLGSTMQFDLELDIPGKGCRVFDTVKQPITVNNEIIGVQTTAKDITPIVHSHVLLEKQAKQLDSILESITDAFFTLDKKWCFTYVNSVFANLIGHPKENLIGKKILEQFPLVVSTLFYSKCTAVFTNEITAHFEDTYPIFGVTYRFNIYPSAEGVSVYFTDITKEKKMQYELEKLSLVASNTDNSVIITNANGLTEWVNEGFTKTTGYNLSDLAGKEPGSVLQGPETNHETIVKVKENLQRGLPFHAELINYKKSGEKFWVSMDVNPIQDERGGITNYIAILQDITFRKDAEDDLLRLTEDLLSQNRDLQQFSYIVSHNLRAPVANGLGLVTLLKKADKSSKNFDVLMAHLKTSLLQMDTVLKDVNTILSIRERQNMHLREAVKLTDILKQAVSFLQESLIKFDVEVINKIDEHAIVCTIRSYLFGVFYNLLTNAVKFRCLERPLKIEVRQFTDAQGYTVISFSDNGTGFDTEKAGDNIFKLYKRFHTDIEGRGLGLFQVKTYLEAMGGHIDVKSQVNTGTQFIIHLP